MLTNFGGVVVPLLGARDSVRTRVERKDSGRGVSGESVEFTTRGFGTCLDIRFQEILTCTGIISQANLVVGTASWPIEVTLVVAKIPRTSGD